nr:MAG TPA: hypothetical protein [Caudoviricetes sp.]
MVTHGTFDVSFIINTAAAAPFIHYRFISTKHIILHMLFHGVLNNLFGLTFQRNIDTPLHFFL